MRQRATLLILMLVITVFPAAAFAQVEAQKEFTRGKVAYEAGRFAVARDFFVAASRTDNRNPEVFLWLGRAHYQLGELTKAMLAWQRTLALAPDEPFAKKMLEVLSGEFLKVDTRIALVETMLREKLYAAAVTECMGLAKKAGLSDAQRARVMTLLARTHLGAGRPTEVLKTIHELRVRYPKLVDASWTTLLLGQAKLRIGGATVAEGVILLRKVVAEHPNTPAAATAQYELLVLDLKERVTPQRTQVLQAWIVANPGHERVIEARKQLVTALLKLTALSSVPRKDARLSASDEKALAVALDIYKKMVRGTDAYGLTKQLTRHLDRHYAARGAWPAAVAGAERLLKAPLPSSSRLQVLQSLRGFQHQLALERLKELAKRGQLNPGPLPQVVASVLATIRTIRREYPEDKANWLDQALLARRIGDLASMVQWPTVITEPKPPMKWAVELALPVILANSSDMAVLQAITVIKKVVPGCQQVRGSQGLKLALAVNTQLLSVLSKEHQAWRSVMGTQERFLDSLAQALFRENVESGRGDQNPTVSAHQKRYLEALVAIRYEDPSFAPSALQRLNKHLNLWIEHGHDKVAEEMLSQLAKELPLKTRRRAELAVVKLWVQKVTGEHGRLTAAGLVVPRRLDPKLAAAARRLYELQDGLDEKEAFLQEVRGVLRWIVDHYVRLDYGDVAEKALAVKGARPVAAADTYAQLQLAHRQFEKAKRELERFMKQYNASDKITLTPAFRGAIDAYTKFISDHTTGPLVNRAAEGIIGIARVFDQHKAHKIAARIYQDFARFAAGVKRLAKGTPNTASVSERASFDAVLSLEQHARQVLAKQLADRKKDAAPPTKLSDEFAVAIKDYKNFLAANPQSVLAARAVRQIENIALEYATLDAWDVAEKVYAGLLVDLKTLRRPERLTFARAVCVMGKVMPDHARKILTALIRRGVAVPGVSGRLTGISARDGEVKADHRMTLALAAVRRQEFARATQVAQLRDRVTYRGRRQSSQKVVQMKRPAAPLLSDTEIARREAAMNAAYVILRGIIRTHPHTASAKEARAEIMVMIRHWRSIRQWERSAALTARYLADNPTDAALPSLRLEIARDYLAWAAQPVKTEGTQQEKLAEVTKRFEKARAELSRFVVDFPRERSLAQAAQWDLAQSWLTQARAVSGFSSTLARGQYVRAARELQWVAVRFENHPNLAQIPQMLWNIGAELFNRQHYDEAVIVWNELTIHHPTDGLAQQAAMRVAQTYESNLGQPLRAAELYQELNFARGRKDATLQNAIFNIGTQLKNKRRWVEALHVLESFVDSFPRHANAGRALTMIGQIHQANEAWTDAIEAYRRVIEEYRNGNWVHDAKWSIAECTISLSRWRQAADAYRIYFASYPKGRNAAEAKRRIEILKDLVRYQMVVDEKGQRKAFDAQYQIATIVRDKLSNPVKAIIEFRKVAKNWKASHLADDALYAVGMAYLKIGETAKAREALLQLAVRYGTSPLADDALYMVGKTYEEEAVKFAAMNKAKQFLRNDEIAQKRAYLYSQVARRKQRDFDRKRVAVLKKAGKKELADMAEAQSATNMMVFGSANVRLAAERALQEVQQLTAVQLADRQDKINASLRKGLGAYEQASKVAGADKAGDALLRMAVIYDEKLKDAAEAMRTWLEIVRQFSGTAVAEDASWKIARYYESDRKYQKAITAYEAFLRNYRRSPRAGAAQFAIAENFEHLGKWVNAMDAYTNYINNFPRGPLVEKARQQINWIKTYRL